MSNLSRKVVAVGLTLTTAIWFAGSVIPAFAQTSASTIATLMAEIQALQTQLTALQGGSPASAPSSSYRFTQDLTLGSKGGDVTALQQILVNGGYLSMPAGTAYGYFGALTKTAVTAWQKAVGVSATGYFGPKSRAALASVGGNPVVGGGVIPPVYQTGAPMTISLATNSPMSQSVASGAVNAPVAMFNFTAGATPVTVTSVTLTRVGLSQDSDLNNVYLYDGAIQLASNLGFNNGRVNFANGNGLFTVPANTTKTIGVTVDVNSGAPAGHILSFGIASASDVVGGTFTGSFPVYAGQFTTAAVTNLAKLQITGFSSSTVSVNAGQTNYLVAQFTIQATNNPAKVTYLRFTNVGSVTPSYLQNIKLMSGSTQLGNTVASLDGSNVLAFDLSNAPLMLTSGQSTVLSLYADITGGVNRTFQFSIQQSSDVHGVDTMYGVGIGADANIATVAADGFPVNFYNATISNGGVVISKDVNTPSTYAVAGNTSQVLAKFDVLASGDSIRFNELDLTVNGTATTTNLRIVDDQGVQIGTTAATVKGGGTYQAGSGNLNYIIPANATRVLTVYGDLDSNQTGSISITLANGASSAQSYSTLSTVNLGSQTSNSLSVLVSGSNLAGALNYGLGSPVNASAGSSNMKVASFALTAGQVNNINFTGVTLTAVNNATVVNQIRNLRVMIGSVQIGTTYPTVTAGQAMTFNSGNTVPVTSNASVNVDVYADLASSVTTTSSKIVDLTSVNASTVGGNAVSVSGPIAGQVVSFNAGGSITGAIVGGTANSAYVGMGIAGVTLAQYQFAANSSGSANLTQVNVLDAKNNTTTTNNAAADTSSFWNYRLVQGTTPIATAQETSSGVLSFNISNVTVPASQYVNLSLVADSNVYPFASSSGTHAYALTSMQYVNSAGATTTNIVANNFGGTWTVYRTSLNVSSGASVNQPSSISGIGTQVAQFNFTAGTGYDALVKTVTMNNTGALVQASTTVVLGLYDAAAPSTVLATSTATSTNNMTFNMNGTTGWTIPAGTTKTLIVKEYSAPTGLVAVTSGTGSYQASIQAVTWNDSVVNIASLDPTISLPIGGQNLTNLSN